MRSCTQRDDALLATKLANASLLMLGDSTSAQVLWHACDAYSATELSFVDIPSRFRLRPNPYPRGRITRDNHACELPGEVTLGSFSHYGVTGPPYWTMAYPLAPWLADSTLGMVRRDMPKFRSLQRKRGDQVGDPTLIVASSGFWDIASWWANEQNFSRSWRLGANHTTRYVDAVSLFVSEVRRVFPRSAVVWRLMHPGLKHSISPSVVEKLNGAIRSVAPSWRLPLVDGEAFVNALSRREQPHLGAKPYGTVDGRHLHPYVNLALLNLLLNLVDRALRGALPYRWQLPGSKRAALHR